jgi:hypothetical protein
MEIIGGRLPTAVKKEIGAMLATPAGDMVLTQAIAGARSNR